MSFYGRVAGWNYVREHARDFAWGGGDKDFVLALLEDEAGAGFTETPQGLVDGWVPYVEVTDVDVTATLAAGLGGTIVRQPFKVPGVGRNCLLRDPLGAYVGISLSRHGFPVPRRQFGVECYLSAAKAIPIEFYVHVFDWEVSESLHGQMSFVTSSLGEDVAVHVVEDALPDSRASWIPSIRAADLDTAMADAKVLGGEVVKLDPKGAGEIGHAVLRDPNGAVFALWKA